MFYYLNEKYTLFKELDFVVVVDKTSLDDRGKRKFEIRSNKLGGRTLETNCKIGS